MSGRSLLIGVVVVVLLSSMFGAGAFAARETGTIVAREGAWQDVVVPPEDPTEEPLPVDEGPDRVIAAIAEYFAEHLAPPTPTATPEPSEPLLPPVPAEPTAPTAVDLVTELHDSGVGLGVIVKLYALGYTNAEVLDRLESDVGWGEWIGSGHLGDEDKAARKSVSVGKIMSNFSGEESTAEVEGDLTGDCDPDCDGIGNKNAKGNNGGGNGGGNNGGGNGGGNSAGKKGK